MHARESSAHFWESLWGLGSIAFLHSISWPTVQAAGMMALCLLAIGFCCGRIQAWLDG